MFQFTGFRSAFYGLAYVLKRGFFFALIAFPVAGSAAHHSQADNPVLEYPQEQWQVRPASELGIAEEKIQQLFDLSFSDSATQAVVLIKDGYLVGERYAKGYEKSSYGTSWSMAKSIYASLIGIAIDRGEIASLDDKVAVYLDYFNDERAEIVFVIY